MRENFKRLNELYRISIENGFDIKKYPIGIAEGNMITVYDGDLIAEYQPVKVITLEIELPPTIQTTCDSITYKNRCIVIVGKGLFETDEDFVAVLHEFVHCYQYESCETGLKSKLKIANHYVHLGNHMWEISHPFPYDRSESKFIFDKYLKALSLGYYGDAYQLKKELSIVLEQKDFEYLVWQEWKEGYARFVENEIRKLINLKECAPVSELNGVESFSETGSYIFKSYGGKTLTPDILKEIFKKIVELK